MPVTEFTQAVEDAFEDGAHHLEIRGGPQLVVVVPNSWEAEQWQLVSYGYITGSTIVPPQEETT